MALQTFETLPRQVPAGSSGTLTRLSQVALWRLVLAGVLALTSVLALAPLVADSRLALAWETGAHGTLAGILPAWAVAEPAEVMLPLVAVLSMLFAGIVAIGGSRRQVDGSGLLAGMAAFVAGAVASAALVTVGWWGIRAVDSAEHIGIAAALLLFAGLVVSTQAVMAALYGRLRRRYHALDLTLGAFLWWHLLTLAACLAAPASTLILGIPLCGQLLLVVWALEKPRAAARPQSLALALSLTAIPSVLLLVPLVVRLLPLARALEAQTGAPLMGLPALAGTLLLTALLPQFLFLMPGHSSPAFRFVLPGLVLVSAMLLAGGLAV